MKRRRRHPNRRPSRGDDVQVKFTTKAGQTIQHCAVVVWNGERGLEVEFASGMKYTVPHGQGRYRLIEKEQQ